LCTFKIAVGCFTTASSLCHCAPVKAGDEEMSVGITVHGGIAYANHDGVELAGDLYLPKAANAGAKAAPALVAVHGGGWVAGVRGAFQYWGPYFAARDIAVFAISYRLATKSKTFPEAVQDVLAGVQFLRGKASAFGIDPARIGLLGASAGAHLAALAALSGKKFVGAYPQDAFATLDTAVKALVGVYGVYDLYAMWCSLQVQDGRNSDNKVEKFIGAPPMANRQIYFDASPISYATYANNAIGVLLATGTNDDLVDPKTQTEPFQLALKQAGFFVRPCIVPGAPHYWMNDPIEEPGSLSGFLAPRLLRFLAEKL
jgi:acetyl esterase/lipase